MMDRANVRERQRDGPFSFDLTTRLGKLVR